jgi:hypothetical protein
MGDRKRRVHRPTFNTNAKKAVNRLGLWILVALYKHPPQIVGGHIEVRLGEMRDKLVDADDEHRKWLRARITAWTWVQRWVKDLQIHRYSELKDLAELAAEEIKAASDTKIPPRAPVETFAGWKRSKAA